MDHEYYFQIELFKIKDTVLQIVKFHTVHRSEKEF